MAWWRRLGNRRARNAMPHTNLLAVLLAAGHGGKHKRRRSPQPLRHVHVSMTWLLMPMACAEEYGESVTSQGDIPSGACARRRACRELEDGCKCAVS